MFYGLHTAYSVHLNVNVLLEKLLIYSAHIPLSPQKAFESH